MIQSLPAPHRGIIAHRGAQDCAPENTLEAIEFAYKKGANWVEVDIQLTRDHQWVVFHDDTLLRACGRPGYLAEHTLAELKALPIFGHYSIPTLSEVLSVVWQYRGIINLEVKIDPIVEEWMPLYIEETQQLLESWPVNQFKPLLSSFNHHILHTLFSEVPGQPMGFLMEEIDQDVLNWCARHADRLSINFQHNKATEEDFRLLKRHQLNSYCYTVNDPASAHDLLSKGVTGVFTDIPCTFLNDEYPPSNELNGANL